MQSTNVNRGYNNAFSYKSVWTTLQDVHNLVLHCRTRYKILAFLAAFLRISNPALFAKLQINFWSASWLVCVAWAQAWILIEHMRAGIKLATTSPNWVLSDSAENARDLPKAMIDWTSLPNLALHKILDWIDEKTRFASLSSSSSLSFFEIPLLRIRSHAPTIWRDMPALTTRYASCREDGMSSLQLPTLLLAWSCESCRTSWPPCVHDASKPCPSLDKWHEKNWSQTKILSKVTAMTNIAELSFILLTDGYIIVFSIA